VPLAAATPRTRRQSRHGGLARNGEGRSTAEGGGSLWRKGRLTRRRSPAGKALLLRNRSVSLVDYKIKARDDSLESERIDELKKRIGDAYCKYGTEEEEVWIVAIRDVPAPEFNRDRSSVRLFVFNPIANPVPPRRRLDALDHNTYASDIRVAGIDLFLSLPRYWTEPKHRPFVV